MELQDRQKEAMESADAATEKARRVLLAHPELKGFIPYAMWQLGQFEAYLVDDMATIDALKAGERLHIKRLEDDVWAVLHPKRAPASWGKPKESASGQTWLKKAMELEGRKPQVFYRGTTPGDDRRIDEPFSSAKGMTFVARRPESARNYGSHIEVVTAKPEAKILYEESNEFWKLIGRRRPPNGWIGSSLRPGESLVKAVNDVIGKALVAGYDAVSFSSDSDIGTVILDEEAFERGGEPRHDLMLHQLGLDRI